MTTALIAEDERVLATEVQEELARLWPELTVCAVVHDGVSALREIESRKPEVLFLDVQMPELSGIEVARIAGSGCHVVFITAYDHYAIQAFDEGAVDYLLKPLDVGRLAQAIRRVKSRLGHSPGDLSTLLEQLLRRADSERLQWITVLRGRDIQFIAVADVCYFRADKRYVVVVTAAGESLITTPLKDISARLDAAVFWQIHRGVIVNMNEVQFVRRTIGGHLELTLKSRPEKLRISAAQAHQFKHM
jgi:DNA-binding LytR/AlgR family response regulator